MTSALSQTAIKSARPGDVLHDREVTGLRLRVFPTKAVFYVYYRTREGRQRNPAIGAYGKLTISQARDIAREMLAKVALGGDPSGDMLSVRASPTVRDLHERWRADHAPSLKPRTRRLHEYQWRKLILPKLGHLKVKAVTTDDIRKLHASLADAPVQANRVLTLLSKAFNLAGVTPNPVKGVARYKEKKRRAYLSPENAAKLAEAMTALHNQYPLQVALFRLLALTGARLREVMKAEREWIKRDRICLPDSKTGAKDIYLPPPALAIVATLPADSKWLFPSVRQGKPMEQPYTAWRAVRERAGLPWLRIHDLRHTYASAALATGYTLEQIGGLLGHNDPRTTQRYAHLMDDPARAAAASTAETIAGWFEKRAPG